MFRFWFIVMNSQYCTHTHIGGCTFIANAENKKKAGERVRVPPQKKKNAAAPQPRTTATKNRDGTKTTLGKYVCVCVCLYVGVCVQNMVMC